MAKDAKKDQDRRESRDQRPTLRNYLNLALTSGVSVSSSSEEVAAIARSVQSAVGDGRIFSAPGRDAIALHEELIKKSQA